MAANLTQEKTAARRKIILDELTNGYKSASEIFNVSPSSFCNSIEAVYTMANRMVEEGLIRKIERGIVPGSGTGKNKYALPKKRMKIDWPIVGEFQQILLR